MRPLSFALLSLALTACRPAPDDGDDGDGGATDGGSEDGGASDGGGDGGSDGGSDGGGDGGTGDCGDPPTLGTWYGAIDPGLVTTAAYDFDAGVAELVAAAPAEGETAKVDITIDGAIVTNVGYPETMNFWFQDANAAFRTYGTEVGAVAPGDRVRLVVKEIKNYGEELEITALEDFEVIDSGNPVQVTESHGVALSYATHGRRNQHVWGTITEEQGNCGGTANCYLLDNGGHEIMVRVSEMIEMYQGECFEIVAPLARFSPNDQLNLENFDWQQLYY